MSDLEKFDFKSATVMNTMKRVSDAVAKNVQKALLHAYSSRAELKMEVIRELTALGEYAPMALNYHTAKYLKSTPVKAVKVTSESKKADIPKQFVKAVKVMSGSDESQKAETPKVVKLEKSQLACAGEASGSKSKKMQTPKEDQPGKRKAPQKSNVQVKKVKVEKEQQTGTPKKVENRRVNSYPKNSPQALAQCAGYEPQELAELVADDFILEEDDTKKKMKEGYKIQRKTTKSKKKAVRQLTFRHK